MMEMSKDTRLLAQALEHFNDFHDGRLFLLIESENMRIVKEVKKLYCLLRLEPASMGLTMDSSITGILVLCVLKAKKEKGNSGLLTI